MGNELKFVLASLSGLPEKEKGFVRKILDDFRSSGVDCATLEILSDTRSTLQAEISSYIPEKEEVDNAEGDSEKWGEGLLVHSLTQALKKVGYELKEGLILTLAANFNESLLISDLTTIVYDKDLGSGLPYGIDLIVDSFEDIDADFLIRLWKHKNKISCLIAETKRTVIRELCAQDIDEVIKISREEHILRFVEDGRVPEEEQKEKLLAYINNIYSFYDYGIWGIFDKADGSLIGLISIDLLNDTDEARYETGFFIRRQRLGQGFAKEALEMVINYAKNKLSASKLIAITGCDNEPAISLLEKCGFTVLSQNDKIIYAKQLEE